MKQYNRDDIIRQGLNLLAPIFMWAASSWPQMTGQGRTAKAFSDLNDSLLVPYGIAFAIWLPIFTLCVVYGIMQALKINQTRMIFRRTGWWTGAGFICVGLWSLTAYFVPLEIAKWATIVIFIPIVACFLRALFVLQRHAHSFDKIERRLIIMPIALIAGWTSLASFLNLAPFLVAHIGYSELIVNIAVLVGALIFTTVMIIKLGHIWAYAVPVVWGLGWLAVKRIVQTETALEIGYVAIFGAALIILMMTRMKRLENKQHPQLKPSKIALNSNPGLRLGL